MPNSRNRPVVKIGTFLVLSLLGLAVGCSSSSNSPLGIQAPQHRLSPTAKALRDSSSEPAPLPHELAKSLLPTYIVEPGDGLLIQPVELDSPVRLPADQPVLIDGTVDLGKYGRPVVAGKTVPLIEAEIQALIKAQEKNKEQVAVTVRLINRVSKVYYVLGEVNSPGAYPLAGRETVLDGIIAAGGLTRNASEQNIILSRPTPPHGCRIVLPICYRDIVQVGDTATNYQLAPGDRIYVASTTMLEGLCPARKTCGPCDRCQHPCDLSGSNCTHQLPISTFVPAQRPE